uniref:Uncharacterized protein n=1 Tax=Solanum lycopersicum TaxID=4081 RepID=A0A3Q7GQV1_SOLLC
MGRNKIQLMQGLAQAESKREMIENIAIYFYNADDWKMCFSVKAHMEKLNDLKQTLSEAHEKISYYEPKVENINTVEETDAYKQYLLGATKQIQRSKEPVGDGRFEETDWMIVER